jgi:hypothetical protein
MIILNNLTRAAVLSALRCTTRIESKSPSRRATTRRIFPPQMTSKHTITRVPMASRYRDSSN